MWNESRISMASVEQNWILLCVALIGIALVHLFNRFWTKNVDHKKFNEKFMDNEKNADKTSISNLSKINIVFASTTGTSRRLALNLEQRLVNALKERNNKVSLNELCTVKVIDLGEDGVDPEEMLLSMSNSSLMLLLLPTWIDGEPNSDALVFFTWLRDAVNDFRVQHNILRHLNFAIFGLGSKSYDNFNRVAKNCHNYLRKLSANAVLQLTLGDEETDLQQKFEKWTEQVVEHVLNGEDKAKKLDKVDKEEFEVINKDEFDVINEDEFDDLDSDNQEDDVMDLEDLGQALLPNSKSSSKSKSPMLTPQLRSNLSKQGYSLLGSHSGVKTCRWTKHMLRDRGGCYKHSFYGIASHQCMETTPSLACANKCVFCWRHHTNPVSTEWKWNTDEPELIVEEALKNHCKNIKQLKGLPGAKPERFEEALKPRHCALSLVGEPIMYPHINRLIELLHERGLSTFLVTNAQFPEELERLSPVTQLYVSIDAGSRESLRRIDRPLFKDFWRRFTQCLQIIRNRPERTVYRLTLVKAYNEEQVKEYAELIRVGEPDLIEIKGVTFANQSRKLTMDNVPWHEEVLNFGMAVADALDNDYEMACEHEHSNCVLIAHKKLKIGGKWHTWIDFDKFHQLVEHQKSNENFVIRAEDYVMETPNWAVLGSEERGFDPVERRFVRNKPID